MQDNVLKIMESEWASTCKVLFGKEVGKMEEFIPYFERDVTQVRFVHSNKSKKPVFVSEDFPRHTKFISMDEVKASGSSSSAKKLNINDIKDIDSIVEAAKEQAFYAGNIALGNSSNYLESNRLFDSHNVFRSQEVFNSKNIAYCNIIKYSENAFGSDCVGKGSRFVLKGFETYDSSRVLESIIAYRSSDLYYTANCDQCQSCMFSFNLRGARRSIGNNPLPPDKFEKIKSKLLEDMADELEAKRSLPSIVNIVRGDIK